MYVFIKTSSPILKLLFISEGLLLKLFGCIFFCSCNTECRQSSSRSSSYMSLRFCVSQLCPCSWNLP